mgnify:CR=1 FL=1
MKAMQQKDLKSLLQHWENGSIGYDGNSWYRIWNHRV